MKQFFRSYLGSVITAWLLVVIGMGVGGSLCPQKNLYPLFISVGMMPAAVFIAWALGDSRRRTWMAVLFLIVVGSCLFIAHHFELGREYRVAIPLVLLIVARRLFHRTEKKTNAEPAAGGYSPEDGRKTSA